MLSAPPRVTSCSQTHKNPWLDGKIPAPNELYWGGFLASIIWISVLTCVFKAAFKRYILGVHPSVFVTMPFLYMRYTQNTGRRASVRPRALCRHCLVATRDHAR